MGAEPLIKHDLATARRLVKESGYDGYPVVVLQTTDKPFLNAAAVVTRNRLESIGFKAIKAGGLVNQLDRAGSDGST
jgi:peptide/nickel transport system substrate-binding protein